MVLSPVLGGRARACFALMTACLIVAVAVPQSRAGVPPSISITGYLADAAGQPVQDGVHDISSLFMGLEDGPAVPLWDSGAVAVTTNAGRFVTAISPPLEILEQNADIWVEIVFNGEHLSPRLKLQSVPFAMLAETVTPDAVGHSQLAEDLESLSKMSAGLVSATTDINIGTNLSIAGNVAITAPGAGISFPDGSVQTTAAAGGGDGSGIPSGYSILGSTSTPPPGFTYAGTYLTDQDANEWAGAGILPILRQAWFAAAAPAAGSVYFTGGTNNSIPQEIYTYKLTKPSTWTTVANMLRKRKEHCSVALDDVVYVLGGNSAGTVTNSMDAYDPINDVWTPRQPMQTARTQFAAAALDGKIYAIGGISDAGVRLASVEVYDPGTDSWSEGFALPEARSNMGAAALEGLIYVPTGQTDLVDFFWDLLVLDPAAGWTKKARCPAFRLNASVQAARRQLFLIGGMDNTDGYHATVYSYIPDLDLWRQRAPMTYIHSAAGSAVLDDEIYIVSGQTSASGYTPFAERYRPYTLQFVHTKN